MNNHKSGRRRGNPPELFKRTLCIVSSRWFIYPILILLLFPLAKNAVYSMMEMNGFTIIDPLVPTEEIMRGGPPRDGIPSIDTPKFISANKTQLQPHDKVLGITLNGVSKAYPINILNFHELVNDVFEDQPIAVSFCPLCGTGIAFDRQVNGSIRTFGVSGLLYNSDLLMYDRESESLWSQIEGKAINGPEKGALLKRIPLEHTHWGVWKAQYPTTLVLSEDTGYWRNYQSSPYPNYNQSDRTYFPVSHTDKRYHPKTWVIGIEVGSEKKVYPFPELAKTSGKLTDIISNQTFLIEYNSSANSAKVYDSDGKPVPAITAFWFAWMTFHPESQVFKAVATPK